MAKKRKLTSQREAFAGHYALQRKPSEAYRHAYPKTKAKPEVIAVEAQKLLNDPNVALRIEELMRRVQAVAEAKFDITAEKLVQELAAIGLANADDYFEWGSRQRPVIHRGKVVLDSAGEPVMEAVPFVNIRPSGELTRVQKKAIAGAEMSVSRDGTPMVSVKLHDKLAALKSLGQHLGMFKIDVNMQGKGGGPVQLVLSSVEAAA